MPRLFVLLITLMVLSTFAGSAFADDNVLHSTFPVDAAETIPTGPDAECFGVEPGTPLIIDREGTLQLTRFLEDHPQAGRFHLYGQISGVLTVPSAGIRGTVREQINEIGSGDDFVGNLVAHVSGTTADGSELKALVRAHITVHDGEVKVRFFEANCIK